MTSRRHAPVTPPAAIFAGPSAARAVARVALAFGVAGVALVGPAPGAEAQRCQDTALSTTDALSSPTVAEHVLRFREAWPLSDGSGITIAVIDTGVADHPRLGGVVDGGDVTGGAGAFVDCDAHGTFVAGLAAGRPGPDGFAGVAPGAEVLSIRQTTRDAGDLSSLALAVDDAVAAGARVINVSLTSCAPPEVPPPGAEDIMAAVVRAEEAGAVVVAASGNTGDGCPEGAAAWPAILDEVLAVSAIDTGAATGAGADSGAGPGAGAAAGSRAATETAGGESAPTRPGTGEAIPAGYAITADWVDVAAPGGPVLGPSPTGEGLVDLHVSSSNAMPIVGTSFAAPLVSGTAALVLSRNPSLPPLEVRRIITATASPVASTPGIGVGVVDPVAAVAWAGAAAPGVDSAADPPPAPVRPDPAPALRVRALFIVVGLAAAGAAFWSFGTGGRGR